MPREAGRKARAGWSRSWPDLRVGGQGDAAGTGGNGADGAAAQFQPHAKDRARPRRSQRDGFEAGINRRRVFFEKDGVTGTNHGDEGEERRDRNGPRRDSFAGQSDEQSSGPPRTVIVPNQKPADAGGGIVDCAGDAVAAQGGVGKNPGRGGLRGLLATGRGGGERQGGG